MSPRTLKIALVVSVALNLFAVAARGDPVRRPAPRSKSGSRPSTAPARTGSPMRLVDQLDPAVRERVRETLRASALAARPDFEEARRSGARPSSWRGPRPSTPPGVDALLDRVPRRRDARPGPAGSRRRRPCWRRWSPTIARRCRSILTRRGRAAVAIAATGQARTPPATPAA